MTKSHSREMERTGSLVASGLPCPDTKDCGSSDAASMYSDGNIYCFSCRRVFRDGTVNKEAQHKMTEAINIKNNNKHNFELTKGKIKPILGRKLDKESCLKWNYQTGKAINPKTGEREWCQIANFCDVKGNIVGQKLRFEYKDSNGMPKKTFVTKGTTNILFGKQLWSTGRKIVITEGELDAISVSQIQGHAYPVVSVPNGWSSAKSTIQQERDWLEANFEEIILMMDNDDQGRQGQEEVAELFEPGKVKVATLPLKDASEMLVAGRDKEVYNAIFQAKPFQTDGIVTAEEVLEDGFTPIPDGLDSPWPEVTSWSRGYRDHEMYAYGAGTGVSKTDTTKDIIANILKTQDDINVGLIYFEEPDTAYTLNSIAAKIAGVNIVNLTDEDFDKTTEMSEAAQGLKGRVTMYKPTGDDIDEKRICNIIRDMHLIHGCKQIVLDHITYMVDGKDNQLVLMQKLMASLNRLNKKFPFTLHYVSHLRKASEGNSHEEGGRVHTDDFVGGKAIIQYSHVIYGLEGDRQHEDEERRNFTTIRCLKNRLFGFNVGKTAMLRYDVEKGQKFEMTELEVKKELFRRSEWDKENASND
jgi:twinkle protein